MGTPTPTTQLKLLYTSNNHCLPILHGSIFATFFFLHVPNRTKGRHENDRTLSGSPVSRLGIQGSFINLGHSNTSDQSVLSPTTHILVYFFQVSTSKLVCTSHFFQAYNIPYEGHAQGVGSCSQHFNLKKTDFVGVIISNFLCDLSLTLNQPLSRLMTSTLEFTTKTKKKKKPPRF